MSPPFAMIPDISRSGTPPIPPLAPSAYAEMLRAQRDLRDVLLARSDIDTRGSERDEDGDRDGMYDSIDAAFPEGNQRTSGDGERETRDGARGREHASEYDELRGLGRRVRRRRRRRRDRGIIRVMNRRRRRR